MRSSERPARERQEIKECHLPLEQPGAGRVMHRWAKVRPERRAHMKGMLAVMVCAGSGCIYADVKTPIAYRTSTAVEAKAEGPPT